MSGELGYMDDSQRKAQMKRKDRGDWTTFVVKAQEVRHGQATALGDLLPGAEARQAIDGGAGVVEGVGGAQLLPKAVLDSGKLHNRAGGATGDDTAALGSGAEHDHCSAVAAGDWVRKGLAAGEWDGDLLLAGNHRGLLHCIDDLFGGGAADANLALPVSDDDDRTEAQLLTALDDLGHAADLNHLLVEAVALLARRATAAPVLDAVLLGLRSSEDRQARGATGGCGGAADRPPCRDGLSANEVNTPAEGGAGREGSQASGPHLGAGGS